MYLILTLQPLILISNFLKKIYLPQMMEYTEYAGNFYGLQKDEIDLKLESNDIVFAVVEIEGVKNLKFLIFQEIVK